MSRHGVSPAPPQPETSIGLDPSEAEVVHTQHWRELTAMHFANARKNRDELSGLLVDIDATKAANDELGHEVGNYLIDVIHGLTSVIPQQIRHEIREGQERSTDIVTSRSTELRELDVPGVELPEPQAARIGGDEFGILLPHTDKAGALVVKERLQKALDEWLDLPEHRQLKEVGVGISIGVATLDSSMKNASDFLRAMDLSMYANKIDQLPELTPAQQAEFIIALQHLKKANVRLRDAPKYVQKYGVTALAKAFEDADADETAEEEDRSDRVG